MLTALYRGFMYEMYEPLKDPNSNSSYMSTSEENPEPQVHKEEPQREYFGKQGAGCLFLAKSTGNVLFALRSDKVVEPNTWSGFGGKVDAGETPAEALERELMEEAGFESEAEYQGVCTYKDGDFEYFNYLVLVNDEFNPTLNDETSDFSWTSIDTPPEPLHFGIGAAIPNYKLAIKKVLN